MAISHDEAVKKLAELRKNAEGKVKAYNEAYQDGKFQDAVKLSDELDQIVGEYTSVARDDVFEHCKGSEDPMLEAVKILSFMTIGVKDEKKSGEDAVPVRTLVDKERQIDLYKLHKYCGEIGADKNWLYMAEQFNCLLTAQKAVDLGLNPKEVNDSFAMSAIAKAIDMGKNPTSKTNLLKTLQSVVTAMIGDGFKATSHDVNFLMSVYSRKNRKALTVTTANHKALRGYLAEICHRIVLNKQYAIDFKRAQDK